VAARFVHRAGQAAHERDQRGGRGIVVVPNRDEGGAGCGWAYGRSVQRRARFHSILSQRRTARTFIANNVLL
jgi:hypothetical protein